MIIIVDSSDSSLEKRNETKQVRQRLIYVEKLSMNELENIKNIRPVLNRLDELDKKKLIEIFIGGIPIYYYELLNKKVFSGTKYYSKEEEMKMESKHKDEINNLIISFYHNSFARVRKMISKNKHKKGFLDFIIKYKKSTGHYIANENESTFILSIKDSCFRTITKSGNMHIIPVNNSIDIILKKQINDDGEVQTENFEVKNILNTNSVNELESLLNISSKISDDSFKLNEKKPEKQQNQQIQEQNKN